MFYFLSNQNLFDHLRHVRKSLNYFSNHRIFTFKFPLPNFIIRLLFITKTLYSIHKFIRKHDFINGKCNKISLYFTVQSKVNFNFSLNRMHDHKLQ